MWAYRLHRYHQGLAWSALFVRSVGFHPESHLILVPTRPEESRKKVPRCFRCDSEWVVVFHHPFQQW